LVAAAVVSALKGFVWLVQALRDGKVTAREWLEFIEYNISIALQFLWMYVVFSVWGLISLVPPFAALGLSPEVWTLIGLAVVVASFYFVLRRQYLVASILALAGLLIALYYQIVELGALLAFTKDLLAVLLIVQGATIAYTYARAKPRP